MKRAFNKLIAVIFWLLVYFLSIFYTPEKYYSQWIVLFFIYFIIVLFLVIKFMPSKKTDKVFELILNNYEINQKKIDEIRKESIQMEFTCPECEKSNVYWTFLRDYKCPSCQSELWSTSIKNLDIKYRDLFNKMESLKYFKVPGKFKGRINKYINTGIK